MFRLLDSGLPKDPVYPADWEKLGYFINDEDEIRQIENPRAYFRFFLTKNERYNAVQREAMNTLIREEVVKRLHNLGMKTVCLPLGVTETEPHIPILISSDIAGKKRVVILFYEHNQDLGVFAYRVVGGPGGIDKGSAVNFVKYIQYLSGPDSQDSPGIILANLGQLRWWRRGKKAVSQTSWFALPQKNAVSGPLRFDAIKNTVPENRTTAEHVAYIFEDVTRELLAPEAMLEVIGVSAGAIEVIEFFNKPENWKFMEPRITALALVATFHQREDISNPEFAEWLRKRGRAYLVSPHPTNTPIANFSGNVRANPDDGTTITSDSYGCPAHSLGERYYSEVMLPKGYKTILDWFQEVATAGKGYENPAVVVVEEVIEGVKLEEIKAADVKEGLKDGEPESEELKCKELNQHSVEQEETEDKDLSSDELNKEVLDRDNEDAKEIEDFVKIQGIEHVDETETIEKILQENLEHEDLQHEDLQHGDLQHDFKQQALEEIKENEEIDGPEIKNPGFSDLEIEDLGIDGLDINNAKIENVEIENLELEDMKVMNLEMKNLVIKDLGINDVEMEDNNDTEDVKASDKDEGIEHVNSNDGNKNLTAVEDTKAIEHLTTEESLKDSNSTHPTAEPTSEHLIRNSKLDKDSNTEEIEHIKQINEHTEEDEDPEPPMTDAEKLEVGFVNALQAGAFGGRVGP